MPDPYLPLLVEFEFSDLEKAAIESALANEKPWDWAPPGQDGDTIKAVKSKILDLHMQRHGGRCCYCRKNMSGGGHFVIDREHVLPKSIDAYKALAFEMWNLGVSCKRCNMQYKKDRTDFVIVCDDPVALQDSTNYRLIHPNFDRYKDHISIKIRQDDDITVVKYMKVEGSTKGEFTYSYFKLDELEVENHDVAQGRPEHDDLGEIALQAQAIARAYGQ